MTDKYAHAELEAAFERMKAKAFEAIAQQTAMRVITLTLEVKFETDD